MILSFRRVAILLTLLASTTLFVACAKEDASQQADAGTNANSVPTIPLVETLPDKPGIYNLFLPLEKGRASYTLYLPESYTTEKAAGFVLVLHDGGGRNDLSQHYGAMMLQHFIAPAFEELDAIMVAPHSGASGWSSTRNQEVVKLLIEQLTEKYSIDPNRTLVTGYSMGGSGSWFFAEHREDFFRAAIPIAGRPQSDKTDFSNSIYIIHSNDDEVVAAEPARTYFEKLKEAGVRVKADFLNGLGHYQTRRYAEPLAETVPWILESWEQ